MNTAKARAFAKILLGNSVGGWNVIDYIGNGKSAVVVRATKEGKQAALKVFSPDLVDRFGRGKQIARIDREKSLIGKHHPNLVEILDGGECPETNFLFVAMEYLPYPNLAKILRDLPREKIFPTISQIASAAEFLEENRLAHRDIKPQNIVVSDDFQKAILLDLGVLRPVNLSELTDETDQKVFIATLRYSPPELLMREEEDNTEGWRAITFYQLGATLYDMIMKKRIFEEFSEPYARLVTAVLKEKPSIWAEDVSSELILLSKCCLLKEPQRRLSLVNWNNFHKMDGKEASIEQLRDRIRKRQIVGQRAEETESNTEDEKAQELLLVRTSTLNVYKIIRSICVGDQECFPRLEITNNELSLRERGEIRCCFRASTNHMLLQTLTIIINISLLNLIDEILQISYTKFLAENKINNKDINLDESEVIYSGPYDENAIRKRMNLLLLGIMDECIEKDS